MKVPIINTNKSLLDDIKMVFDKFNSGISLEKNDNRELNYTPIPLADHHSAIKFINYQTPTLLAINFSDEEIDCFKIMENIVADPWLNHGGIIAFYEDQKVREKIEELQNTNIIISMQFSEVTDFFLKVMTVIHNNSHILFQRTIHSQFTSSLSGKYLLDSDVMIIPCYVNLITNYLYNMGFIDGTSKYKVNLSLSEMLINAIEHGNCGITAEEKTEYMEKHGVIHGLIKERCQIPERGNRKVTFQYDIDASHSTYHIADMGDGFDWRSYVDKDLEVDFFALHGRGILLTMNSIDDVSYNEKGNEVSLTLNHRQQASNTVPLVFQDHESVQVKVGEKVFEQGEDSDFLYYISEGEYRVEINEIQVSTITPADILIGEMSFLLGEARSATVIAKSPGKLMKISKNAFINSIKEQPYYGLFLAKLLAKRLDKLGKSFTS